MRFIYIAKTVIKRKSDAMPIATGKVEINLMQIRALNQVVIQGSVSKAADVLCRTQSAVTRSIRFLEQNLGVSLFERHSNGMLLTSYGKCILPRVEQALAELMQIPELLSGLQNRSNSRPDSEPLWLFNLRRLEIFIVLSQNHHMQTTANQLRVSQPAISAALKILESGAGVQLLARTARGLMPSLAGREIIPSIRRALNTLSHIPAEIAACQGILRGVVRIGALPLGRTRLLPQAIVNLTTNYPGIQVITNESTYETLAADMRAGDIDLIFGALRADENCSDMQQESLFSEQMLILVRAGHPLTGKCFDIAELQQARWILPRSATPARYLLNQSFRAMGMPIPEPVIETGDLAILRGILMQSDMLAAVSTQQLEVEILSGDLVALPLNYPQPVELLG
jgi:LysR family transcriptional regulator, regulator for genes of the gallate degradation pathway